MDLGAFIARRRSSLLPSVRGTTESVLTPGRVPHPRAWSSIHVRRRGPRAEDRRDDNGSHVPGYLIGLSPGRTTRDKSWPNRSRH